MGDSVAMRRASVDRDRQPHQPHALFAAARVQAQIVTVVIRKQRVVQGKTIAKNLCRPDVDRLPAPVTRAADSIVIEVESRLARS